MGFLTGKAPDHGCYLQPFHRLRHRRKLVIVKVLNWLLRIPMNASPQNA